MRSSFRSSGVRRVSAISRSATTGFLSRSRSMVSDAPPAIMRARWLARRTSSKRFSTLSMQSSTVTRAMVKRLLTDLWDQAGQLHASGPKCNADLVPCAVRPIRRRPDPSGTARFPTATGLKCIALQNTLLLSTVPSYSKCCVATSSTLLGCGSLDKQAVEAQKCSLRRGDITLEGAHAVSWFDFLVFWPSLF